MKKLLLPFLALLFMATQAWAQTSTPVLWGTATVGGAYGVGSLFVRGATGNVDDEHNFGPNQTDGFNPYGSLLPASDGLLYGLTSAGGANDSGAIVSYNIITGVETDVHDFSMDSDGAAPYGSLVQVGDSLLYGMTSRGGTYNDGIIFSYNIFTGKETNLYNFSGGSDGAKPSGSLYRAGNGLLYGLTTYGGYANSGVIFSYDIATATQTGLYEFYSTNPNDGQNPTGSLIEPTAGVLYGMTPDGGAAQNGMIFLYDIEQQKEVDVYNFGYGNDGNFPLGSLIQVTDTSLYGMTYGGGVNSNGTLFSFNTVTNHEAVRYSFGSDVGDASYPEGSLIQASDSLLYGTTNLGGVYDSGAIISYTVSTGVETVLHSFDGADGFYPAGDLVEVDSPVAGVKQLTVDNGQLTVFPNPATDFIYVSFTLQQTQPVQISLYNMLGQEVYSTLTHTNSTVTVPVTDLADGVYVLRMNEGGATQQREVVVAR